MKKISLSVFSVIIFSCFLLGQNNTTLPNHRTCGTPLLPNEFENWLQSIQSQMRIGNTSNNQVAYTLPVIIHIIHNGENVGTGSNISNTQAMSQITVLNKDFSATNTDITSVPSVWTNLIANTEIQFCPAQVDPNGNVLAEPGIDRVNRNTKGFTAPPYTQTYIDNTIKPNTIWNPNQYLNIWCLSLGNSLLGYATFPNPGTSGLAGLPSPYGSTTTDGVVILNTALGNIGATAVPYDKGRTATHEIGHWLGLRHIWGDGTCATDYCNDTPGAGGSNFGCPTFPLSAGSCTGNSPNGEMFMNYMDYTDDLCMYMFTNDQKTRMQAIMAGSPMRMNLATSTKCSLPFALDAGILTIVSPANGSSSCSNSVTPQITLRNYGSSTITSCNITYSMDGGSNQIQNWTGSLTSGSSVNVSLNPFTGLATGTHTLNVSVSNPNGGTDQNAANNSSSSIFNISSGQTLPFVEGFEGTTFVPASWSYTPINNTNKWARVTTVSGFGTSTACAKMDNFTGNANITGQKDIMTSPPINFSGANNTLKLKFDVAYAKAGNNSNDSLNVYISTDCGTNWSRIYTRGGTNLATAPNTATAFTPTATQWRKDSVSLSTYANASIAYFRFESVSGSDNNVYLDNINIGYISNNSPVAAISSSTNSACIGQSITLNDASSNGPSSWTWSMPGGTPTSANTQNTTVSYTTAGTYTVTLNASNSSGSSTATLVLNVSAAPNITVASSNNNVCSGNPVTISASGASIYTWSNNTTGSSITVSPTSTTTYSVTGTDQSGCSSTQTITINVNQVTPANISVINDTICITNSPQILSGTPTGGTFFGTGVINGNFDPQISGAGNFTIGYTYTDNNSCSDSATAQMTVELCTSLNDLILSDVKIFPNPAQNIFSIDITSNENSKMNVNLLDVRGREIMQTQRVLTSGKNTETFNVSELESGVYFVSVQIGEKIFRTKLVKEN